jgi:uncharacterized YigZ family protein
MAVFSYRTLQEPGEGLYKEKGSKFLAFAYPVVSESDIKERLDFLRKKYFDARHHCYAWMLGPEKKVYRANDDGEPNHSAGDPILGQIRSRDLTNVLIVVVRYFGGTKLGVGGLISAYKLAAEEALRNAPVAEREVKTGFVLYYEYSVTPDVMKLVRDFELEILQQDFQENCILKVQLRLRMKDSFLEKVTLMDALGSHVTIEPFVPGL